MSSFNAMDLKRFFRRFSQAQVRLPAAAGNRYEFFLFLTVCEMARQSGFSVSLATQNGNYIVRASPGSLGGMFGHAQLTSPSGGSYQLHNGIEIDGQSGMLHEADVLLIGAAGTAHMGGARAALKGHTLVWTAECKLYGSSSRLKGESRKAVGAALDWSQSSHQSNRNSRAQGCLHCGMGFDAYFVTNIRQNIRQDIKYFLGSYEIAPCFGVIPRQKGLADLKLQLTSLLSSLP
jgi:hypothetical protein